MSKKIKKQEEDVNMKKPDESYPVFCFKYLVPHSYDKCKDAGFFVEFLERLKKLASLEWKVIDGSPRHGFGYEKIKVKQLKPDVKPNILTDDVKEITVFRATGKKLPFLGLRLGNTFHVIYIETTFGDVYDH